jgi:tetratricopeptide (TPR) repeat protein
MMSEKDGRIPETPPWLPEERWLTAVALTLLVAVVGALYARVAGFAYIWDDFLYVVQNPAVADGITPEGVWWALTSLDASNWHPLTWLSHMVDTELFGAGPSGPHLVNLAWHLAGTVLLYFVLHSMTGSRGKSLAVTAVYTLHPLRVESVAWIAERKDVISAFFWIATIGAWIRYARRPGTARYLAVLCCLVLGLMAKSTLVTLPVVLLVLDWWPLGRTSRGWRRLVLEKLPLLLPALVAGLLTYLAQVQSGALATHLSLLTRFGNAFLSTAEYMVKTVWPMRLAVLYPLSERSIAPGLVAGAALLLGAVTFLVVRERGRRPYLLAGWAWYLIALLPVLGIVQVGEQAMADRYTYLPHVGLFIALVWLAAELLRKTPRAGRNLAAAAGVVLVFFGVLTSIQIGYWKDEETLYRHTLQIAPGNRIVHYNLALVLIAKGVYPEAEEHLREAVRLRGDYAEAHNNLGNLLAMRGDREGALAEYRTAVRHDPSLAPAWDNLGLLLQAGGDRAGARDAFMRAVNISPGNERYRQHQDGAGTSLPGTAGSPGGG